MTTRRKNQSGEKKETTIYVGPNTKTIQRFSAFRNGLPPYIEKHIKECPSLKPLFVSVEKLNEVQKSLSDPTSAEAILFEEAKKYFEGVKQ